MRRLHSHKRSKGMRPGDNGKNRTSSTKWKATCTNLPTCCWMIPPIPILPFIPITLRKHVNASPHHHTTLVHVHAPSSTTRRVHPNKGLAAITVPSVPIKITSVFWGSNDRVVCSLQWRHGQENPVTSCHSLIGAIMEITISRVKITITITITTAKTRMERMERTTSHTEDLVEDHRSDPQVQAIVRYLKSIRLLRLLISSSQHHHRQHQRQHLRPHHCRRHRRYYQLLQSPSRQRCRQRHLPKKELPRRRINPT